MSLKKQTNNNIIGSYGEIYAESAVQCCGHGTARPSGHAYSYDLIIDKNMTGQLIRCQIKTTSSTKADNTVRVHLASKRKKSKRNTYSITKVDCFLILDYATHNIFIIPNDGLFAKRSLLIMRYNRGPQDILSHFNSNWAEVYNNNWDFMEYSYHECAEKNNSYWYKEVYECIKAMQKQLSAECGYKVKHISADEFADFFNVSANSIRFLLAKRLGIRYNRLYKGYSIEKMLEKAKSHV